MTKKSYTGKRCILTVLQFVVSKNLGTFVITSIFMSPRDFVGEINGETSDINAHTAFERNCFPFFVSELRI